MESPQVSIIMPTFNSMKHIVESIESVRMQSYKNWELIIVDDASNDGTVELVRKFVSIDNRINLIQMPRNTGGPASPRNLGVEKARGDYVAFLDSDDLWHLNKLEVQLCEMLKHGARFSSTASKSFRDSSTIDLDGKTSDKLKCKKITYLSQRVKGRIPNSSVLVEKQLIIKHKFNECKKYRAVEDYDCWLKIHSEIGSSIKLDAELLFYRISDSQISKNKLDMIQKVYWVHKNHKKGRLIQPVLFAVTHGTLGLIQRLVSRGM